MIGSKNQSLQNQNGALSRPKRRTLALPLTLALLAILTTSQGCVSAYIKSVGGEQDYMYQRVYVTDFNTAWQATLEALKNTRLDITNREGGLIQSRWRDNTAEKNLTDNFGVADSFLKSQFRFKVSVSKGFYNGLPTVKVRVQKEQLIQRDVLEGWVPIETDAIDETTLLYRIGRLIFIRTRLAQIEEQKARQAIMEAEATQF